MKIDKTVLLSAIVAVGFLVYIGSNELMRRSLVKSKPKIEEMIIIGKDTVQLSEKVIQVQTLQTTRGEKTTYLNVFPKTLLWISYHSLALTIALIAVILLIFPIRSLVKEFHIKSKWSTTYPFIPILIGGIVLAILLSSGIVKLRALISGDGIIKYFRIIFEPESEIVRYLVGIFLFLAVVPIFGITVINLATKKLSTDPTLKADITKHYKSLREKLNTFALVIGFLVSISIIGTKLQKKMIGEQLMNVDAIYPDEFVYLYALTFTLVLALFFLPSLFYLKRIKADHEIKTEDDVLSLGWWKVGKESVDDIKVIFSMILPLITSISQII